MGADASKAIERGDKVTLGKHWTVCRARKGEKKGGHFGSFDCISVFEFSGESAVFEANLKILKRLRHPNIIHPLPLPSPPPFTILTEALIPLSSCLLSLDIHQACSGLYDLLRAIHFLHHKVSIVHRQLACMSSYFISCQDASWKIGAFELAKLSTDTHTDSLQFVAFVTTLVDSLKLSCDPDGQLERLQTLPSVMHAELSAYNNNTSTSNNKTTTSTTSNNNTTTSTTSNNNTTTSTTSNNNNNNFFLYPDHMVDYLASDFLSIRTFLNSFLIHTPSQREHFFISLTPKLLSLPEEVVAVRLTSLLLQRFVMLEVSAQQHLLPHLLTIKKEGQEAPQGILSESFFRGHVVKVMLRVLKVREVNMRLIFLKHFAGLAAQMSTEELKRVVLRELLIGLKDTNDELVSQSLKALAFLVTLLGADVVVGANRKTLFYNGVVKPPRAHQTTLPPPHHSHPPPSTTATPSLSNLQEIISTQQDSIISSSSSFHPSSSSHKQLKPVAVIGPKSHFNDLEIDDVASLNVSSKVSLNVGGINKIKLPLKSVRFAEDDNDKNEEDNDKNDHDNDKNNDKDDEDDNDNKKDDDNDHKNDTHDDDKTNKLFEWNNGKSSFEGSIEDDDKYDNDDEGWGASWDDFNNYNQDEDCDDKEDDDDDNDDRKSSIMSSNKEKNEPTTKSNHSLPLQSHFSHNITNQLPLKTHSHRTTHPLPLKTPTSHRTTHPLPLKTPTSHSTTHPLPSQPLSFTPDSELLEGEEVGEDEDIFKDLVPNIKFKKDYDGGGINGGKVVENVRGGISGVMGNYHFGKDYNRNHNKDVENSSFDKFKKKNNNNHEISNNNNNNNHEINNNNNNNNHEINNNNNNNNGKIFEVSEMNVGEDGWVVDDIDVNED